MVASVNLRVLMVSPGYLPSVGGVETHTYEVGRRLATYGARVTVLASDRTGALAATEERDGVSIRRVQAYPAGRDWYFAPRLAAVIREGDWDVIHCQGAHTLVPPIAMAAAKSIARPYVVTFHSGGHSSASRNAARSLQLMVLRPLLLSAARLIAVSDFEAEHLRTRLRLSRRRFEVIPNGVDLPALGPSSVRADPSSGPLIVSVGRLEKFKGHHKVLQALPRVIQRYPDVRLEVIGSGPYEGALRALVERLGLGERVVIRAIPTASRDEMAELLSRADLVTLLSEFESQGLAAAEAASLRRPVLVANGSALTELVEQGLASAVAVDADADATAAAILAQLDEPLVPGDYSLPTWDRCSERLYELYRELAA